MDSTKLHPFSIESLTSPEKKSDCCGHRSVVSNIHSQHQQTGPLQHITHQGHVADPMTSFYPNLVSIDTTVRFEQSSSRNCVQNLFSMENLGPVLFPSINYGQNQFPVEKSVLKDFSASGNMCNELDSRIKSPSSKRLKLDHGHGTSPSSTDSGISRCHTPGGASDSTGTGSRSSSPIDVLSFDGNDSILAPANVAKRMIKKVENVDLKRSLTLANSTIEATSAAQQVSTETESGKIVKVTNSRKRQRDGELKGSSILSNKNEVDEPRTEDGKPVHSYIALISKAILSHPDKKMVLSDIYQFIMGNFPYYNNDEKAWRNSIRHNLSLNECFIKVGRAENGKGNYWSIHPSCVDDFSKGDYRRRQARRRARTVVTPLELRQTVGIQGLGIPQTMFPHVGPRSAPPAVHSVVPSLNHIPSSKVGPVNLPGSVGYVPMTPTTVRDSAFHPYFSTFPNFNFFQQCTPAFIPTLPVLPALYQGRVVGTETKVGKHAHQKLQHSWPVTTENKDCKEASCPDNSANQIPSHAPTLQDLLPTISCTIPPLPANPSYLVNRTAR